jgi:hypothetical protein
MLAAVMILQCTLFRPDIGFMTGISLVHWFIMLLSFLLIVGVPARCASK